MREALCLVVGFILGIIVWSLLAERALVYLEHDYKRVCTELALEKERTSRLRREADK